MIPYSGSWSLMLAGFQTADALFFLLVGCWLASIVWCAVALISSVADTWRDMRQQPARELELLRAQCAARASHLQGEAAARKAA
jgi:hypothetical protein